MYIIKLYFHKLYKHHYLKFLRYIHSVHLYLPFTEPPVKMLKVSTLLNAAIYYTKLIDLTFLHDLDSRYM